jgi:iron complex transport system permease protein
MTGAFSSSPRIDTALSFRRFAAVMVPCLLLFLIAILAAPWVGSSGITLHGVISGAQTDRDIFFIARLPRVLFGALAGGALGVAGVLFQALLRNSLATPFTLGISSGSSLGAVIAIALGLDVVVLGVPIVSLWAFAGAFLTIFLVFYIARSRGSLPTFTLLLAGVTLNFIFGALILFLHVRSNFGQSDLMTRWMMGSLATVDYRTLLQSAPFVFIGTVVVFRISSRLNLLAAGEEWAAARGVDVPRLKKHCYFAGSILTGAVTAFCGPIGFVGLVVPHALRLIVGSDHRILVPGSFFLGGAFLILCDTVARTLLSPNDIPVGVITALVGGPFFIVLLKRKQAELW